jgi:cell division protein FtsL
MEMMTNRFVQAYRQAPWRVQLQWIALFTLALLLIGAVAYIYLSVSAIGAAYGREIQSAKNGIQETQRKIADLQSQLAEISSSQAMLERAQKMGYKPISTDDIEYRIIQDYPGRQTAVLALPPSRDIAQAPIISAQFTRSLLDWLLNDVFLGAALQGAAQ